MIPRMPRGLIVWGIISIVFGLMIIDENDKKHRGITEGLWLTALPGCFVVWHGTPYLLLLAAVRRRKTFIKDTPELRSGESFVSMDGKSAIVFNKATMRVMLVDNRNKMAVCKPGDILSCELEEDRIDGQNFSGRGGWLGFFGGLSASEVEADRVKSVTLRVRANNMEVSSVNLYFLKNIKYRGISGSYAEAVNQAKRWEARLDAFSERG